MKRTIVKSVVVAGSASDVDVKVTLDQTQLESGPGTIGVCEPYAIFFKEHDGAGSPTTDLTTKSVTIGRTKGNEGKYDIYPESEAINVSDLNSIYGPETDGFDAPPMRVDKGVEFTLKMSNANASNRTLVAIVKYHNASNQGEVRSDGAFLNILSRKGSFPGNAPNTAARGSGNPFVRSYHEGGGTGS